MSSRPLRFATLDVFTETRFKGNPLAIVHVPRNFTLDQALKQQIALEFNLSETVFLHDGGNGLSDRNIDIFTTTAELPWAGHPTIGTICYLCTNTSSITNAVQRFTLHTKAGPIAALYDRGKRLAIASIPHNIHVHKSQVRWEHILRAQPHLIQDEKSNRQSNIKSWCQREDGANASFPLVSIVDGVTYLLVDFPLTTEFLERLRSDQPAADFRTKLDDGWSSGFVAPYYYVVLPDRGDGITRCRSRMIQQPFSEDAATGSAASALASYLSLQRGQAGKPCTYEIEQGVEMGRGSHIGVEVTLNDDGKSVKEVLFVGILA